jgi:hypothetical protein
MFKVERHYNQYKISVGDGRPTVCHTATEAAEALKHYYGESHTRSMCPFCKWEDEHLDDWRRQAL